MITLPSLAGLPGTVSGGPADQLAARCALALATPGPIHRVRTRGEPIEHAFLRLQIEARLFEAARTLQVFRPRVHIHLGDAPAPCECLLNTATPITVWLANANGSAVDSRWMLERRWHAIERAVPGLAATALSVLESSRWIGAPTYTPSFALSLMQEVWWMGEDDERYVVEEYRAAEEAEPEEGEVKLSHEAFCEQNGIVTRARVDKAMPLFVSRPKRSLKLQDLERIGAGRGRWRDLARAAAALWSARIVAEKSRPKFEMHSQQDEVWAVGFGAFVRWNGRDPMNRILDDHGNRLMESEHVEEAWGWFVLKSPGDLVGFFAELAERLAIARLQEQLLEQLADRSRE